MTRPTSPHTPSSVLDGVQILRFIAAFLVVAHHALEECQPLFGAAAPADWLVRFGACGVDVFFAISGFIMVHASWRDFGQPGAGRRFLARRALRVFPLYWLVTGAILALHFAGLAFRNVDAGGWNLVASVGLLPVGNPVLGVAWTLVFEIYFYGCFALWIGRAGRAWALAGIGVTLVAMFVLARALLGGSRFGTLASPLPLEFAFGMGLAVWWRMRVAAGGAAERSAAAASRAERREADRSTAARSAADGRGTGRFAALVVIGLGLLVMLALGAVAPADGTAGLLPDGRVWAWGLPAAAVLAAALRLPAARGAVGHALVRLGDASYALYLTHPFVMIAAAVLIKRATADGHAPGAAAGWLAVAAMALASVVLGWLAHRAVEWPITARLRRLPALA